MNRKALITGAAAAALLTTCFLVPSFAFLSAKSPKVVNHFVSALITVDLKETLVDPETGKKTGTKPEVYENTYLTVAGRTVDKDPTPIILKNSTDCCIYVGVRNEYPDIFSIEDVNADWTLVVDKDNKLGEGVAVYKYNAVVAKSDNDQQLSAVFEHVRISENFDGKFHGASETDSAIEARAFAVQSENTAAVSDGYAIDYFSSSDVFDKD